MGIENEPADVRFLQDGFEAFGVTAFRQPKTRAARAQTFRDRLSQPMQDLRALRFGKIWQQRQERVGRGAGDDLETAGLLQLAKSPNDIALQSFDINDARGGEELEVEMRQLLKLLDGLDCARFPARRGRSMRSRWRR